MREQFFKVNGRPITPESWGDYGYILQHGMTAHSPRTAGKLSLERTGPYVPPVTLPGIGSVILTDETRKQLESSGLVGFSFRPVEKKLIVDLAWETWDLSAEEPAEYPDSGEPEDYILGKPHSPDVAITMGDLWELVVEFNVEVLRPTPIVSSYKDLRIDLKTWDGSDLLRSREYGGIFFTKRARDWFSERWGRFLVFEEFPAA